jgi:hypothetical protein
MQLADIVAVMDVIGVALIGIGVFMIVVSIP